MAKFKFSLEAGALYRGTVRNELHSSKEKLEYYYGGNVSIREEKGFFESEFFVVGIDFPDTDDFEISLKNWVNQIKNVCN